jgi:hypothetical protein
VSELNVPLLRKTMEYIEAHPQEWDQDEWVAKGSCGTTMCFAGTAAYLMGAVMDPRVDVSMCTLPDGSSKNIEWYAAEQLGLTVAQARAIFYSSVEDPRHMREVVELVVGEKL